MERRALPARALTADTSVLTALANDFGFHTVFARQVAAYCRPADVVVGISTSGESRNVVPGHRGSKTARGHDRRIRGPRGVASADS